MANTFGLNTAAEVINGTAGADTIYGGTTTNATGTGNDTINGLAAADTLFGLDGNDSLFGGSENDTVYGGDGNDSVGGDANDDFLFGGVGNDSLSGGTENDIVHGDSGNDSLHGGTGRDALFGDTGVDALFGDDNEDSLFGGGSSDVLNGGFGNDALYGDVPADGSAVGSSDTLSGDDGTDRLYGGIDNDVLYGGIGTDRLYGGSHTDRLFGDSEDDRLFGGAGSDSLYGGAGNDYQTGGADGDVLFGGTENDVVLGGGGADLLRGDAGIDRLFGGLGDDTFTLGDVADTDVVGGGGVDRVVFDTGNNTLGSGRYVVDLIDLAGGNDVFQLANLAGTGTSLGLPTIVDGSTAFEVVGAANGDGVGNGVRNAGDVNGDGFDDFILGSAVSDVDGANAGAAWVVFGKASGFASSLVTSALTGTNGFRIGGLLAGDGLGAEVSGAGDVNGDGFDDLIVGAPFADVGGADSGSAFVLFGKASEFTANLSLSSFTTADGFALRTNVAGDQVGRSVAGAGDVNGDGIDDIVIGASLRNSGAALSGSAFVVFGRTTAFASPLDLTVLTGADGFHIDSSVSFAVVGGAVAGAGDVNGDGIADVIVNAAGENAAYVVFGKTTGFAASVNAATIDGTNGFRLAGFEAAGVANIVTAQPSVRGAGDVNGDGIDDLIVGDGATDGNGDNAGAAWVVFGRAAGFAANVDVRDLDGVDGFRLDGLNAGDVAGASVSGAGDVNGDGFDDILVAASSANQPGFANTVGSAFLVYGHGGGFAPVLTLGALDATQGINLHGVTLSDLVGQSVSAAGDVNGDGYGDILVGAPNADLNTFTNNGRTFVVFGGP